MLSWRENPRDKSKESDALSGSYKRKKEDSCIGELNKLKNEIQNEIARERNTVVTPSAAGKTSQPTTSKNNKLETRKPSDSQSKNFHSLRLADRERTLISSQLNPSLQTTQHQQDKALST